MNPIKQSRKACGIKITDMSKVLKIGPIKYWYMENHIDKLPSEKVVEIYDILRLRYKEI